MAKKTVVEPDDESPVAGAEGDASNPDPPEPVAPAVDADADTPGETPRPVPALIEGANGGVAFNHQSAMVNPGERCFNAADGHFEHVRVSPTDGRWVYRKM